MFLTYHWRRGFPGQGILKETAKGLGEEEPELVEAL